MNIDKHTMQHLIDAPLANAVKLNLPAGRRSASSRRKAESGDDIGGPKLAAKELRALKQKQVSDKLNALFDYYAKTDIPAAKVAEHVGIYRNEQTGTSDDGRPIFTRVLDVKRVEDQLAWRRAANA